MIKKSLLVLIFAILFGGSGLALADDNEEGGRVRGEAAHALYDALNVRPWHLRVPLSQDIFCTAFTKVTEVLYCSEAIDHEEVVTYFCFIHASSSQKDLRKVYALIDVEEREGLIGGHPAQIKEVGGIRFCHLRETQDLGFEELFLLIY